MLFRKRNTWLCQENVQLPNNSPQLCQSDVQLPNNTPQFRQGDVRLRKNNPRFCQSNVPLRQNNTSIMALFCSLPLGTKLDVRAGDRIWSGNFSGVSNCVITLAEAQLLSDSFKPIIGTKHSIRIPVSDISFVREGCIQRWPCVVKRNCNCHCIS
ncbi:hypothetical protein SAMN02745215_01621 [Desulfitobacterium chlororespirans DSM 11544]|uniref:Uncharacterized protein n=1 Tax=Desulfitobacterium chlororespirans DSM 11544 TaxID=1121395 RepID=A0A1M7T610_9FIRM|nr:hypothetical protein SAMN02745215_01621 [Desulfitobacterium chlororespirans DSM 11544]